MAAFWGLLCFLVLVTTIAAGLIAGGLMTVHLRRPARRREKANAS